MVTHGGVEETRGKKKKRKEKAQKFSGGTGTSAEILGTPRDGSVCNERQTQTEICKEK